MDIFTCGRSQRHLHHVLVPWAEMSTTKAFLPYHGVRMGFICIGDTQLSPACARSSSHPSGQPHRTPGPLSILLFPPLSPCLGTDPALGIPQVSSSFTSLALSSLGCKFDRSGLCFLGNHRVTESCWLEKTLKTMESNH